MSSDNKWTGQADRRTFLKTATVGGLTLTAGCSFGGGGGDGGDGGDGGGGGGDGGGGDGGDGGGGGGDGGGSRGDPVEADYYIYNRASDEARHETKLIIADALEEALGMSINREILPSDQVIEVVIAASPPREHDIATQRTGEGYDPDPYLYGFFHSEATQAGGINMSQVRLPEFDEMYDQQKGMTNTEERQQLVNEMQELVFVEHPQTYVPLFIQNLPALYRTDRITNVQTISERILMNVYNFIDLELVSGDWPVVRGAFNSVEYINPLFVGNRENREHNDLLYDRLVRIPPGETEPEPWAAESFEAIDDTTYEFTLREGMTFHDGEDVTPEDVRFSFEYFEEESGTLDAFLEPVDELEIDGLTITANLSEPYAPFLTETLRRIAILPQHIWEDVPDSVDAEAAADWSNPEPVGSGIFEFDYWEPGEEMRLVRNDDHFMDVNTESYIFRLFSGQSAMAREVEAGNIDIAMRPTENAVARLTENENIDVARARMQSPIMMPLNCAKAPMNSGALREAISHVVPKADVIETVWFGAADPIGSNIAPGIPGWTNQDVPVRAERDDETAVEVLEDAGFTWDDSGQLYLPADYEPDPPAENYE